MAEEKKFPSVSEAEKQKKGVTALADRPNLAATYGKGGLTAAELKKWFDGLASLIIDKYNLLGEEMQSGDATEYIGVPKDAAFPEGTASTLKDVLAGIVSGALAQYLVAYAKEGADGGAGTKVSLQSFVLDALKRIGTAESDIDALESRATSLEGSVGDDTTEGTVKGRVKSLEGRMHTAEGDIDSLEIKMTTAEGDIDNLEKRASRVEDRATTLESRASDFDSSFIVTDGRLTTLEGRASTAESNISYIKGKLASFGLLQNVVFDESTDKLTFTFVVGDATKQIPISLADFIDSAELSSQISEKVSALAKEYVDQAKASASNASASETAADSARNEARIHGDRASAYKDQAEASAQRAANSASEAQAARESAMREASTAGSMAMDASSYATQAKASADKAEMYSQTSEDRWSVFDKRLTNVENGISADPFVTDDTVAYQKTAPASALPFAAIERVGGISYKCRNLFNGELIRGYYDANGTLTMSSAAWLSDFIYIGGKTVTFSATITKGGDALRVTAFDGSKNFIERSLSGSKDESWTYSNPNAMYVRICVFNGNYDQNTMQLEYGDKATPYMPYFEGIRNTAVSGIESESGNLFNSELANKKINGLTIVGDGEYVKVDGTKIDGQSHPSIASVNIVLPVGTYTLLCKVVSGNIDLSNTSSTNVFSFGINNGAYCTPEANAVGVVKTKTFTLTEPLTIKNFSLKVTSGGGAIVKDVLLACQLSRIEVLTDFSPYFPKQTFHIPEAWQSLPYYGYGINADVNNHIEFEPAEYVQMCSERAYQSGDENNPEVVTDGTRTVYALSTPVRTHITFRDNYIRVDGGGTLTFVNEHKIAVPSTVLYLTKEASV